MLVPGEERQQQIDEATARCRRLAAQIAVLQAELVAATRQLDELAGGLGGLTTAQHLSTECQLLPAEARRTVRLARRLPATPGIAEAFAQGRLSEGTVSVLSRVATADNEDRLLETARVTNPGQLQRVVNTHRQVHRGDDHGAEGEPDELVRFGLRDDGMWHASARLSPHHGAQVEAALRAAGESSSGDQAPDDAEALVRMAQGFLSGGTRGVLPERFLTVVHVRSDGRAHLQGGGALDAETTEQLWCESWASAVLHDRGVPVTATSPQRFVPRAMLSALHARDRGCRLCGSARFLCAHHIVPHAEGGPTSLANLVLLCGSHHRRLHRRRWRITGDPAAAGDGDDRLRFWRADGWEITCRSVRDEPPPPSQPAEPPPDVVDERASHNADRLDAYALDVLLDFLHDPPPDG